MIRQALRFGPLCLVATACAAAALPAQAPTAGPARPNIVLILADDLGYGDIGAFNPKSRIPTPHVDRLAREGLRFTDAHSTSGVCTPTRYGLLTGRYSWRTHLKRGVLWGEGDPLIEPGRPTLASMLKARGYATGVVGKWHLGLGWKPREGATPSTRTRNEVEWIDYAKPFGGGPRTLGFDAFFGIAASLDMPPYVYLEDDRVVALPTARLAGIPEGDPAFYRAGIASPGFDPANVLRDFTDRAVRFVRAHAGREPFFLYLPLASPHTPVMPTGSFRGRTGIGAYGDFVAETDAAVGEVLRALDDTGAARDTLVIFTADNGPAPLGGIAEAARHGHDASGGWRGVKAELYEGGHRVPFVVRWPGRVPEGTSTSRLVGTVDVLATLASVTGAELPETAAEDSVSFAGALRAPEADTSRAGALIIQSANGSFGVREGRWKLILTHGSGATDAPPAASDTPAVQLYDLDADPRETTNLASKAPEVVARLSATLEGYRTSGRSRK